VQNWAEKVFLNRQFRARMTCN